MSVQNAIAQEMNDFRKLASTEQVAKQKEALENLREFLVSGVFSEGDFIMVKSKLPSGEVLCHEIVQSFDDDTIAFQITRYACDEKTLGDKIVTVREVYNNEDDWDHSFNILQGLAIDKIYYVHDDRPDLALGIYGSFNDFKPLTRNIK